MAILTPTQPSQMPPPPPPQAPPRPPPPPNAPVQARFDGDRSASLVFAVDGFAYHFRDPSLLRLALAQKPKGARALTLHNQDLAMWGDRLLTAFGKGAWRDRGGPQKQPGWYDLKVKLGIGTNRYLAFISDSSGIAEQMVWVPLARQGPPNRNFTTWEKATAIEALIGAIDIDAGEDHAALLAVMRRLFVAWPERKEDDETMENVLSFAASKSLLYI